MMDDTDVGNAELRILAEGRFDLSPPHPAKATIEELAAEVVRLRAENTKLRGVAYVGDHHFLDLTYKVRCLEVVADLRTVEAERDALRAIIAPRTTPPTTAELLVHESAGGRWRCVVPAMLHMCADALHKHAAFMHIESLASLRLDSQWWALDGKAQPCAWPVVGGGPCGK